MPLGEQFGGVLAAAKTGAEWALAALYRECQPALLRYLRAQAPADAEDLGSEIWIDVSAGLVRFDGDEGDFRRWLFTIARRRLIDLRRRDKRREVVLTPLEGFFDLADVADPQAEAVARSETEAALALLAALPLEQAEVVLLRVLGGLDVDDVAAIVGKKPGAVRVLQHRALKRLAKRLEQPDRRPVTR